MKSVTPSKLLTKRQKLFRDLYKQRVIQIMVLCGIVWMIIFNYVPMFGIYTAFSHFNIVRPIFDAPFAGLFYFRQVLNDPQIPRVMFNTLGISFFSIAIGFPVPIIFALLLNEMRAQQYKKVVQTISYLPHFVSWVILGGFVITWTSEFGLINELLLRFGFIDRPIFFLGDPRYFWGISVGTDIWRSMGWSAIIYIAAISGVNPELYEVATIDGANRFQRVLYVTWPSIMGTVAILFTLRISGLLNSNFDQIMVLRNPLNASRSTVLDIYVFQVGLSLGRFSYAAAVGVLRSIVALFLLLIANKASDKLSGSSFF